MEKINLIPNIFIFIALMCFIMATTLTNPKQ